MFSMAALPLPSHRDVVPMVGRVIVELGTRKGLGAAPVPGTDGLFTFLGVEAGGNGGRGRSDLFVHRDVLFSQ